MYRTMSAQMDHRKSARQNFEDVVLALVDWAAKALGEKLKKPVHQPEKGGAGGGFDPLSYEQQNVHA